ncbi:MAG TPA: hypothetical protein VMY37_35545 [Thermoguttaceae bacterium]|nr:hypothetical protein [Thermoguttaceae bacterium]
MLDEEAAARSFQDFHRVWVEPELHRRFGKAGPPPDFRIFQCLVRLPPHKPAIVDFNDDVPWKMRCKMANGTRVDKGDPVYLDQIEYVESVAPPECEGERVGFVYIHRIAGGGFRMIFEGSAALPRADAQGEESKWSLSDAVCEYLNAVFFERTIRFHDEQQQGLALIGIWPIPSLIPYPLSRCTALAQKGNHEEARRLLVGHCSPEWLEAQLDRWLTVRELAERRELLSQALAAHRAGQYILAIHAIVPHLEGMVSDRLSRSLVPEAMHFRHDSKLGQLRDMALEGDQVAFSFRRVVESTVDFILKGPVLETFKNWLDDPNCMFPNRHVVGHGKFIETLYTEENSVKAFLLLDTLAHILIAMGAPDGGSQAP